MGQAQFCWERITEHLYRFHDVCAVYVILDGTDAILIDFGTGAVLGRLGEIGVERVLAILHTHHHRDQCQGDELAVAADIPIYVPAHERHLFDQVEIYWSNRQLFDAYNVRSTTFTRISSVPVAGTLDDFDDWHCGGREFCVLPTPGHTLGAITLLTQVDGQVVAFSGDLLYAPGKVQTLYDMQYDYGDNDGLEATLLSLSSLQRRMPDVLCPSHGQVMRPAEPALARTRQALRAFWGQMAAGGMPVDELDWSPVTPHILAAPYASSYSYAICSESGHALLVDYGGPDMLLFSPARFHFEPGERARFVEHSLDTLFEKHGVQCIDAVIPTHCHDDHVCGIPYLQKQFDVPCWALENMRETLENPRGEMIGCVLPDPIEVHRTFMDGEQLQWEEYDFTIYHAPGHAEYHMAMFAQIDGHTVAFTGDNVFPYDATSPHAIYRNHLRKDGYHKIASLLMEYQPDILCCGHSLHHNVERRYYESYQRKAWQMTQHFETLLPGEANFGIEPNWVQIYPYQSLARPGHTLRLQVRMTNFRETPVSASVRLVTPGGWTCDPDTVRLNLASGDQARAGLVVHISADYVVRWPKCVIAADVVFDGKRLGQVAEAVVEFERQYT